MPVAITVTHRTRPGARDAVRKAWETFMPMAVSENSGHLFYAYTFDQADADVVRAFQVYADGAAAQAFLSDDRYAAYVEEVKPLVEGPPEVLRSDVIWAKGLDHAR